MKKLTLVLGVVLAVAIGILLSTRNPAAHHLREFDRVKTNFNAYRLTVSDRLTGITDNQTKWNYHLKKLEELGVVQHSTLVFANVPYTHEASKRIIHSAYSNFPAAVMYTAKYHATDDPEYGVRPYVLDVWDFPSNMPRWSAFFQTNNRRF